MLNCLAVHLHSPLFGGLPVSQPESPLAVDDVTTESQPDSPAVSFPYARVSTEYCRLPTLIRLLTLFPGLVSILATDLIIVFMASMCTIFVS